MDIVPVNPHGTLFVSGAIEDWAALGERVDAPGGRAVRTLPVSLS